MSEELKNIDHEIEETPEKRDCEEELLHLLPRKSLRSSAPPLRSMRCGSSCRIITTTISRRFCRN